MFASFLDRSPILFWGGIFLLVLAAVWTPLLWLDTRLITGLPAWAKPIKFALSTGIFLLTMAWLLGDLRLSVRTQTWVAWAFTVIMVGETLLIALQSARGETSHYNISSPTNAAIFATMGFLIAVNSLLVVWLLIAYSTPFWGASELPGLYRWGVVTALALLLFSSAVGAAMIGNHGHTVGAADGGPGLPFLGWSVTAGDLRWAHFLGMHALQLVLLAYFLLPTLTLRQAGVVTVLVLTGTATIGLYLLAMKGIPVVR